MEAKTLPCSGIEECKIALLKMNKGVLPENFIEGMACQGGCVQGPAVIMRSPKNKAEVGKHAKQAGDRTINGAINAAGAAPASCPRASGSPAVRWRRTAPAPKSKHAGEGRPDVLDGCLPGPGYGRQQHLPVPAVKFTIFCG